MHKCYMFEFTIFPKITYADWGFLIGRSSLVSSIVLSFRIELFSERAISKSDEFPSLILSLSSSFLWNYECTFSSFGWSFIMVL